MESEKLKALTSSILEQCREQGLSYQDFERLMIFMRAYVDNAKSMAVAEVANQMLGFIRPEDH